MKINRIKLITILAKKDMTQKNLAELSGVHETTISNIANGKCCKVSTAIKLAEALGVELEELGVM